MNHPLRVLIAEDNPADAKLVLLELRHAGFEPEWERVDTEAAFLSRLHSNWDIILSDYVMPEFGGLRALELLKQSGLDIPFIIISGTIGEDAAVAAIKMGAADYLLKDRLARLGLAVNQAIEQGRMRRESTATHAALRDSEERFREVVQNIEEVFWMTNVQKSEMIFISSAYERIWGRSCESLHANPMAWLDAIHPDDRQRVLMAATTKQVDSSYTEEYRVTRPDGSIRWISDRAFPVRNATGAVYRVAGVAADITERKQAEAENRRHRDELQFILDAMPALVFYKDRDGRFLRVNRELAKLVGVPPEAFIGKTDLEMGSSVADSYRKDDLKVMTTGEPIRRREERIYTPRGERWLLTDKVPHRDESGNIVGIIGFSVDITERKDAEDALRKSEDQLRQSQKMDAIGQLAGGVAHDFNNQLSVILGYANILSEKVEQPYLRTFATNICGAARRSADLTQKLLVFARKGQAQTAPVDLHKIMIETLGMLERAVDKRIVLEKAMKAESAVVIGNASNLQNALLNLGINARDAMPDGGSLTYGTENVTLDASFCAGPHRDILPGQYLKISVSDTGAGMTDEVKKHLFEPFFTTKPVGKGTGLGLASVYGTVKQHAGVLTVSSAVGRGTTFTIYLPLAEQGVTQTIKKSGSFRIDKTLRILVVEDEEILRTMTVYMLCESGHMVHEAEHGKAAVEFYKNHWREIDLIILDMVMPEMNGHDTFLALKKINPAVNAILATGYSLNSEVQEVLDDGVLDFIQKPFDPKQLYDTIARVLKMKP